MQEMVSHPQPGLAEQSRSRAIEKISADRAVTSDEIESQLRAFAAGDWLGQPRKGRESVLAALVERRWATAIRRAADGAASEKTVAAYMLMGEVGRLTGDYARAEAGFSEALRAPQSQSASERAHMELRFAQCEIIQSHLDGARVLMAEALHQLEESGGDEDALLGATYRILGQKMGLASEGESPELHRLLKLQIRHGKDSGEVIDALNEAARSTRKNNLEAATRLAREALEIEERNRISGLQKAVSLTVIGEYFAEIKERKKAAEYFDEALRILNSIEPEPGKELCPALEGYGRLFVSGDPDRAIAALERSLKLRQTVGGLDEVDKARLYAHLGDAYGARNRFGESEQALSAAFDLAERAGVIDTPEFWTLSRMLGDVLVGLNQPGRAEPYFRRLAKAIRTRADESDPVFESEVRSDWAESIIKQGHPEEAIDELLGLITFCEKHFGPNSERTALAVFKLGFARMQSEDLVEAEKCFRRALEIREKVLQENDIELCKTRNALGVVLRKQGRPTEAVRYLEKAFELINKSEEVRAIVGPLFVANYANALVDVGHADLALKVLYGALAMQNKAIAPNVVETSVILNNIWRTEDLLKHTANAEKAITGAYRLLVRHRLSTGEKLPEEQLVLENLRGFYRGLGMKPDAINAKVEAAAEP